MSNFLLDLVTNLMILVTLLFVCHLVNMLRPALAVNGGYVFIVLASAALVFDAALTFLVFADAPSRYGKFSDPGAFLERGGAYAAACVVALCCALVARKRVKKTTPRDTLVIRTSAYTESHLPM